ncbi:MAG: hypothetical protein HYY91_00555 [Candidatus Omnitrophica bacterium]|nr:hypothetical protein [Candidatus Omnitrophota bacterium]
MSRNVLLYARVNTTSYVLMHAVRYLLARYAEAARPYHFTMVFDDRRDRDLAASLLPRERVTLIAHYEASDPDDRAQTWSPAAVQTWEQQYGSPHLRVYLQAERILEGRSEDEKWRFLLGHIAYYEQLCRRLKPVLCVTGPAALLPSWVGIAVARGNGVPCLIFSPSRFGDRCFLPVDAHEHLDVRERYLEKLRNGLTAEERHEAEALLTQYRAKAVKPIEFDMVKRITTMKWLPRPSRAWRLFRNTYWTDYRHYEDPFHLVVQRALRARRTPLYDAVLRARSLRTLPHGQPFFFYPLQFEPEMSVITQGRGWTDQLELIRAISLALPIDRWLYVKEHPMMASGVRPWRFYRELLNLPRVRLLDQRLDGYAIVPHAEAVITLGSTAGWEALAFGKPALLAGRAFYEEFTEGVLRLDSVEDLPRQLRRLRDRRVPPDALLAFTAAVLTKAPQALWTEPRSVPALADRVLSADNLDRIARLMLDRLEQVTGGPQGQPAVETAGCPAASKGGP